MLSDAPLLAVAVVVERADTAEATLADTLPRLHASGVVALVARDPIELQRVRLDGATWLATGVALGECDAHALWIRRRAGVAPTDLRDLPAPEPLQRYLEAVAALHPGDAFVAHLPRYPRMLIPRLRERGLLHQVAELPDGSTLVGCAAPT